MIKHAIVSVAAAISLLAQSPVRGIPGATQQQTAALTRMNSDIAPQVNSLAEARSAMTAAAFSAPRDDQTIRARAAAVREAELALAGARADALQNIQSSANKLTSSQLAAFLEMGGSFAGVSFTQPDPYNFNDHEGYLSLFNGVSLKGWDGNPKFWRADRGAIAGESTPQNPSGNSYIAYRDLVARDFTLKFEIKVEGSGGSGLQYRSKSGIPWLANIPNNVTANVGTVNLAWMMTGPQADFWPASRDWTGQFYSENTPMRILARRGQVVEGAGLARKQLMGNIGDRETLGRLMAVMVDDDPESSNNQPGMFGIEIEATTKVSVRNIWVKKLN